MEKSRKALKQEIKALKAELKAAYWAQKFHAVNEEAWAATADRVAGHLTAAVYYAERERVEAESYTEGG